MTTTRSTRPVLVLQTRIDRRTALTASILAGLLSVASAMRTQAQEATPSAGAAGTPTPFTGDGFVGEVAAADLPAGEAFVAVVLAEPQAGQEQRDVRALLYGDRENQIREWFTGEATGDRLDLVSDGGAHLEGTWSPDEVTGTITMPDGSTIPIETVPAVGIAGLYLVQAFPDGRVVGMSEAGVELAAAIAPEPGSDGGYPVTGTLTPPEGEVQPFAATLFTPELGELPPSRLIVLDDGRLLGGETTQTYEQKRRR